MAKTRPQTAPARRPPTPRDILCPHQHFRHRIINRDILSRKQHQNLLCTPKGYRWVFMKEDDPEDTKEQDDFRLCKLVKQKPGKSYVHNILAELWSLLTPEMVNRLKGMLMVEFGLTEQAALDFICHSRFDTMQTSVRTKRKPEVNEEEKYEFEEYEVNDEFEENGEFVENDEFEENGEFEYGRPSEDPTLSRLIVEPKLCDKSQFAVGIDPCHIREFSRIVAIKVSEYLAAMMCARRNNRHRRMAEVVLNGLCNLTGEKTTLDNPKNRLQNILTLTSDRVALWLAQKMDDEGIKRDRKRKKEDKALKKRKLEKMKELERRQKEKEKMNKDLERHQKRKDREDAEISKRKQEDQEQLEREKEKRRQELNKFREEDSKKKQEEQRRANEEEEKQKMERKERQEKSKQKLDYKPKQDSTKSTTAKPARSEDRKPTEGGKKPITAGGKQKSSTARTPASQQKSQKRTTKVTGSKELNENGPASKKKETSNGDKANPEPIGNDDSGGGDPAKRDGDVESTHSQPGDEDNPQDPLDPSPKPKAAVNQKSDDLLPKKSTSNASGQPAPDPVKPGPGSKTSESDQTIKQPGGPEVTKDEQETDSKRKIQESIVAITISQLNETKPVPTRRQETLHDILSKELEKRIKPLDRETSDIIREAASKTATWIDQTMKVAESEYGSREQLTKMAPLTQKGKGPLFVLKKIDPIRQHYDVRQATHAEAGRKVRFARKKGVGRNVPTSEPKGPSDPKMWANWAENATQMADDWGHWIDKTIQDAEDKAVRYQANAKEGKTGPRDEDDWNNFVASTKDDALSWRRKKKSFDEEAKQWRVSNR